MPKYTDKKTVLCSTTAVVLVRQLTPRSYHRPVPLAVVAEVVHFFRNLKEQPQ